MGSKRRLHSGLCFTGSRCCNRGGPAMHGDPVAGPWSGRVGMSITQAMAWTSLWEGIGFVSTRTVSLCPRAGGSRAEAHRQQAASPRPSQLPGTALQPEAARQAGGRAALGCWPPHSPGDCSPSRQAEIKATGVSLVGLPWAGTHPPGPCCPYPL